MLVLLGVILVVIVCIIFIFSCKTSSSVPKIIHQTAPTDESKWHEIWKSCQQSWKNAFPDYEYKMWNDEDLHTFMKTEYPADYDMFSQFSKIRQIDTARYYILNTYGGIYADMDYECIRNFEDLLSHDKVSVSEATVVSDERFQNALMASPKNHMMWETYIFPDIRLNKDVKDISEIQYIVPDKPYDRKEGSITVHTCGPQILCRAWDIAPETIHPLPANLFSVATPGTTFSYSGKKVEYGADVYAVHHGTYSWSNLE